MLPALYQTLFSVSLWGCFSTHLFQSSRKQHFSLSSFKAFIQALLLFPAKRQSSKNSFSSNEVQWGYVLELISHYDDFVHRSTARVTEGQRVALQQVENVSKEDSNGSIYWTYEHLSQVLIPAYKTSFVPKNTCLRRQNVLWVFDGLANSPCP